jgi:large subunit ribosomal protein L18
MTKVYIQNFLKKKRYLKKINQNFNKLRLSIYRSNKHIYGQIIDDSLGKTITSSNTLKKSIKQNRKEFKLPLKKISFFAGQILGNRAIIFGISNVVLDCKQFRFHGNIKNFVLGIKSTGILV